MPNRKSYLLLGEGDFTFSLDMCRYLASLPTTTEISNDDAAAGDHGEPPPLPLISVTCTGVDTRRELCDKYKDVDFILRNIQACSTKQGGSNGNSRHLIKTEILHGINAVQAECNNGKDQLDNNNTCQSYDHVLFNHPHLGTEDAQLHSRFLQHFFHASTKRWMKPTFGLLHLTLVNGQCARWKCIEGAKKRGLILLRRGEFRAPPPPQISKGLDKAENGGGKTTHYELRRHQSGRSFANRRRMQGEGIDGSGQNDSETLVFGRASDYATNFCADEGELTGIGTLPWETASCQTNDATPRAAQQDANNEMETPKAPVASPEAASNETENPCACQYCAKSFNEERSWKNHMVCSHPDCKEVQAWKLEKKTKKKKKRKMKETEAKCHDVGDDDKTRPSQLAGRNDEANATESGGRGPAGPPWICTLCTTSNNERGTGRSFPHKQALLDHQRAKHFGAHLEIKPDWYREEDDKTISPHSNNNSNNSTSDQGNDPMVIGHCPICDLPYFTELDKLRHEMEFVPSPAVVADMISHTGQNEFLQQIRNQFSATFQCRHCSKTFRELRAQRQHENFCSMKSAIVQ